MFRTIAFMAILGPLPISLVRDCHAESDTSACALRIRYERPHEGSTVIGHGTAFGVDLAELGFSGKRYMLSAAHNVLDTQCKPFPTLKIEMKDGRWTSCKVISFDKGLDLCLIESEEDLPAVCRISSSDAKVGSPVSMTASPRGIPIEKFDGKVAQRFYEGTACTLVRIKFDHGCSGGPLFSQEGEAIGVAVAGVPKGEDLDLECGLFIPVSGIESFLAPLDQKARAKRALVPASAIALANLDRVAVIPLALAPAALPEPIASVAAMKAYRVTIKATTPVNEARLSDDVKAEVVSLHANAYVEFHVVQDGDNLSTLAARYSVSMRNLAEWNNLDEADRIRIGMKLRVGAEK